MRRQQPTPQGACGVSAAVKPLADPVEPSVHPAQTRVKLHEEEMLLERVLERANMFRALDRVESNRGARTAGVDGLPATSLRPLLKDHWPRLRERLLAGTYKPSPVRRVEIPKFGGSGVRLLGIPTALDRLIQQALLQVLTPIFDPTFSNRSFGFRPGRSAHDAVRRARQDLLDGYRWVVDVDLITSSTAFTMIA